MWTFYCLTIWLHICNEFIFILPSAGNRPEGQQSKDNRGDHQLPAPAPAGVSKALVQSDCLHPHPDRHTHQPRAPLPEPQQDRQDP